jgi:hypothetical protein
VPTARRPRAADARSTSPQRGAALPAPGGRAAVLTRRPARSTCGQLGWAYGPGRLPAGGDALAAGMPQLGMNEARRRNSLRWVDPTSPRAACHHTFPPRASPARVCPTAIPSRRLAHAFVLLKFSFAERDCPSYPAARGSCRRPPGHAVPSQVIARWAAGEALPAERPPPALSSGALLSFPGQRTVAFPPPPSAPLPGFDVVLGR